MSLTYMQFVSGWPVKVKYTPSGSAVNAGDVVVAGGVALISHIDIAIGIEGSLSLGGGLYLAPKATTGGSGVSAGTRRYWDATNHVVTSSNGNGANALVGYTAVTSADADVMEYVFHMPCGSDLLSSPSIGGLSTVSAANGLTAHAGGGQGSATPITTAIARFTTVATAGDSAVLPASVAGYEITVTNATSNSMNVFPATGEAINALSANTAFAVAAGKTATFFCANAGQWHSILSA